MRNLTASLALLALALSFPAYGSFTGKVVAVTDGDTVVVLDAAKTQHIIRLAGIDAPEKEQPFSQRSREHLSGLVFGRQVTIDGEKIDRFNRRVGKVIVGSVDANLAQVKAGMAWHYKAYAKEQSAIDRDRYAAAETASRGQRLGLWGDSQPVAPWEWRKIGNSRNAAQNYSVECPCNGTSLCTGPKGGKFCITSVGKKQYW